MFNGFNNREKRTTDVNIGSGQFNNLFINTKSLENTRPRLSSGEQGLVDSRRKSERSRRESMADAVSEFFYSCSGNKEETKSINTKSSKKQRHADTIKVKKLFADEDG